MTHVLGGVLCVPALWIMGWNWSVFWRVRVRRRNAASWIPLLGGMLGAGGLALLSDESRRWWWLPLIVDWGSAPGILHAVYVHVVGRARQ